MTALSFLALHLGLSLLGQAPVDDGAGETKRRVLALAMTSQTVSKEATQILDGAIATHLSGHKVLDVVTQKDLAQLLELEAERTAAGCDESSCLTEVAGALGASVVIYGQVALLDGIYVMQLNLFDAEAGRSMARQQKTAEKVIDLAQSVPEMVDTLVGPLLAAAARTATKEAAASATSETTAEGSTTTATESAPSAGDSAAPDDDAPVAEEEGGGLGLILLGSGAGVAVLGGAALFIGIVGYFIGAGLFLGTLVARDNLTARQSGQTLAQVATGIGSIGLVVLAVGVGVTVGGLFVE